MNKNEKWELLNKSGVFRTRKEAGDGARCIKHHTFYPLFEGEEDDSPSRIFLNRKIRNKKIIKAAANALLWNDTIFLKMKDDVIGYEMDWDGDNWEEALIGLQSPDVEYLAVINEDGHVLYLA